MSLLPQNNKKKTYGDKIAVEYCTLSQKVLVLAFNTNMLIPEQTM